MKITKEITDLSEFEAWSGATDNWKKIINAGKGEAFITALEEFYPDGIDEVTLNDLLWFEDEFVMHLVGLKTDDEEEAEAEADDAAYTAARSAQMKMVATVGNPFRKEK